MIKLKKLIKEDKFSLSNRSSFKGIQKINSLIFLFISDTIKKIK